MQTASTEERGGKGRLKEKSGQYFKELMIEWRKITFPEHKPLPGQRGWTKAELWRATIAVFVFTTIFAIILSMLDWLIGKVFNFMFFG